MLIFQRSQYLLKLFGNILLVIILSLLQTSFFTAFSWPFNYLNLILPVIFFIVIIFNYRWGLWLAVFIGLIIDLFSFLSFGTFTAIFLITVVFINFLFNNFFTNKSFYSLATLGILGNMIYALMLLFLNFFYFVSGVENNLEKFLTLSGFYGFLYQILFSVIILAILFFIFNFLSKKLKSVFY